MIKDYKHWLRESFSDLHGKAFFQPLHLTVVTMWTDTKVEVFFAVFRFHKRIELKATVQFEIPGERRYIGLVVIEGNLFAFDWDSDSDRLYPCVSSC